MNFFIVGLTNTAPNVASPVTNGYALCGQWPGAAISMMPVICQRGLLPARYVVIIGSFIGNFAFGEVMVYGTGLNNVQFVHSKFYTSFNFKLIFVFC